MCIILVLIALHRPAVAQDTSRVFSLQDLFAVVLDYHPMAQQAALAVRAGDAALLQSRGAFDPKLEGGVARKEFDEKLYWNIGEGALKVPTWFGIEAKVGYETTTGQFLNPERNVPEAGLWAAGISIPIGQGLFIDERRNMLRQAQLMAAATEAQQQAILNDLLLAAAKAYWDWYTAYYQEQILQETVELAEFRFQAVQESFNQGDRPAIDSVEARIQVQNLQLLLNDARVNRTNSALMLSTFLWFDDFIPLELDNSAIPVAQDYTATQALPPLDSLANVLGRLAVSHPELIQYDFKIAALEVDRRWKMEQLKPSLDLTYNALTTTVTTNEWLNNTMENYKYGITFSMPLFLRKERGALQLADIKLQEAALERAQKSLEIQNKVQAYYNDLDNLYRQLDLYTDAVSNYQIMLDAERRLFFLGESSLFLVNSRESKFVEAALKLAELQAKQGKAQAGLRWSAGTLHRTYNEL